jgi:hypothetical protein
MASAIERGEKVPERTLDKVRALDASVRNG